VYASVVTPRFEEVRKALDDSRNFANFTDSPYYFDALYETFSRESLREGTTSSESSWPARASTVWSWEGDQVTGARDTGWDG